MTSVGVVKEEALQEALSGSSPPLSSNSQEVSATLVADTCCILGECVLFDDELNAICWTDIDGKALRRLSLESGNLLQSELLRALGAFALTTNVWMGRWLSAVGHRYLIPDFPHECK